MASPTNNAKWGFDYPEEDIPVLGGDLPSLDPSLQALWSSHSFTDISSLSDFGDSFGNPDGPKESGSRKRIRPGSCNAVPGSKACREKLRRDRLNDRFVELGALLYPERPPKVDKSAILVDATRMITQLMEEERTLKEMNVGLQEKISELKVEKTELRNEKQRLKTEKDSLEQQLKFLTNAAVPASGFVPHHPAAIPAPFAASGQVGSNKLVPFVGYPGVSMWQFMPPAAVDTSQDHVLHPPVA